MFQFAPTLTKILFEINENEFIFKDTYPIQNYDELQNEKENVKKENLEIKVQCI